MGKQLLVCAAFHYTPFVQDANLISILDGAESMCDGNGGAGLHEAFQCLLYKALAFRVKGTGGFVKDEDVKFYFSVADALVLPYRTATQSGVTQIAYNFSVPMVVTNVGGLPEIVPDGRVGVVCEPSVDGILEGLHRLYADKELERMKANFAEERKRFSWATMCDKLIEVYNQTK